MSNQLVPAAAPPWSLQETLTLGDVLAKSGFFADARSAAQAVVKILAGRELGFQTIASMTGIHIIEGKPSVGAHLMASLIKRSGKYDYRVLRCDREACELEFTEKGQAVGRVAMTLTEAIGTGLAVSGKVDPQTKQPLLKTNWVRSADDMLFARCISKGYRRFCPDLTGGVLVYDPDELDAPPTEPRPVAGEILDAGYTVTLANGAQTHVGDTVTTHTPQPAEEAPPANPTAAPQDGECLTEQEYQELVALARQHSRTTGEVKALTTALGVPVLTKAPRHRLGWLRLALATGMIPTADVDRLNGLRERLGIDPERFSARLLTAYGVRSLAHLLPSQAAEIREKLEAAVRQ